jgi:hypothetical protein
LFTYITPLLLTFIVDRSVLGNILGTIGTPQTQQLHAERAKGFFNLLENIGSLPQYIFSGNTNGLNKIWGAFTKIHSPIA